MDSAEVKPVISTKITFSLGFIGGGAMATAMFTGLVRKGVVDADKVYVSGPHPDKLSHWSKLGAHVTKENHTVVENSSVVILAVKPNKLKEALSTIQSDRLTDTSKLFVSLLAGVTIATLEENLKFLPLSAVVRVMPNTPMMVGEGCCVYSVSEHACACGCGQMVENILSASGKCFEVPESMIDAAGGLTGCGPAYIYQVIEAMSDGAVRMGVPRDLATEMAAQTVLGAAKMVLETGEHPAKLKDNVCSPGGSTIAGVHELERGSVRAAFMNAIQAASQRSLEMGKLASESTTK